MASHHTKEKEHMKCIEICKSSELNGSVRIQGSKNSSLALMSAACLADGTSVIENVPDISDVRILIDIMKDMGTVAFFCNANSVYIDPRGIEAPFISASKTYKVRPSYYFIGALLQKHKKIKLGYPGGDRIGKRPIDQHIKGLQQMGARFEFHEGFYTVTADELNGCEIYFDVITGGATLNLIMAATKAKGTTLLYNAAKDPEVVDTSIMLNSMGARISGAGTNTIRIEGVSEISGCRYQAIPDRLIAGTYLITGGVTGGCVKVENVIPEHLMPLIQKLRETGMDFCINDSDITAFSDGKIRPARITADKFPSFETDFQQPVTAMLLKAKGRSVVTDKVYPQRNRHCGQLAKMGADIEWNEGTAYINGGRKLEGTMVRADDIRAGTCLVLAGLFAEGRTVITGVEHIERGFMDIIGDLSGIGARICFHEDKNDILYEKTSGYIAVEV